MLQNVIFTTASSLSCACDLPADVVLCVTPALLVTPPGLPATLIAADVKCSESIYTFEYDDALLTDPNTPLVATDIIGVFCMGCRENYLLAQTTTVCVDDTATLDLTVDEESGCISGDVKISSDVGNVILANADGIFASAIDCVTDTNTVDLTITDSCVSADVKVSAGVGNIILSNSDGLFAFASGGGGSDWHITGNVGTVDGTNFLGTTDNVAFDIRVNNIRARRTVPDATAPIIIDGDPTNAVTGGSSGTAILGGQYNIVNYLGEDAEDGVGFNVVGGGYGNFLDGADICFIGGGFLNIIQYDPAFLNPTPHFFDYVGKDVICGGNVNQIYGTPQVSPPDYAGNNFIGGGETNEIDNGLYNVVVGGKDNIVSTTKLSAVTTTVDFAFNTLCGGLNNQINESSGCFIGGGGRLAPDVNHGPDQFGHRITDSVYSCILGGRLNRILTANYSSIIGGVRLKIGSASLGYSPTDQGADLYTDVSAFSNIAYFGDVDFWIANTDSTARAVKFFEPNSDLDFSSTNYSSFKAQAQGANIDYVWPAAAGSPGDVLTIDTVVGTVVTLKWAP